MDAILSVFGGSESFDFTARNLLFVMGGRQLNIHIYVYMSFDHNPHKITTFYNVHFAIVLFLLYLLRIAHLSCINILRYYKLKIIYSSAHSERDSYAVGNY